MTSAKDLPETLRPQTGITLPRYTEPLEIRRFLQPRETLLIDLPSALRLVHCNSLDLAILQQRYAIAQIDEDLARYAILPDLAIGPRYERHTGAIQDVAGNVSDVNKSSLFTGGLLSFNWDPGRILFEPLAAQLQRESSGEAYADALRTTALDAGLKYYDLVRAQYAVAISRYQAQRAKELADFYQQQFELGQALKADYLRIKSQQDTAEATLTAAERDRETAAQELLGVLRLEHCIDLVTVGPDLAKCSLIDIDADTEKLVCSALSNRADLRDAEQQVELARTNLTNKGITPFLPTPFFTYGAGHFSGSPRGDAEHGGDRSDFTGSLQWQLKSLGLGNQAEYERMWYSWEIACLQEIKLREQIDREVREALIAARASRELIEQRRSALPTAREALQLSEVRLRSGEGLAIDVLQAQDVLTKAESDYINAMIDYDRAQLVLWNRVGSLMPLDTSKPVTSKHVLTLESYTGTPETTSTTVNLDEVSSQTLLTSYTVELQP